MKLIRFYSQSTRIPLFVNPAWLQENRSQVTLLDASLFPSAHLESKSTPPTLREDIAKIFGVFSGKKMDSTTPVHFADAHIPVGSFQNSFLREPNGLTGKMFRINLENMHMVHLQRQNSQRRCVSEYIDSCA